MYLAMTRKLSRAALASLLVGIEIAWLAALILAVVWFVIR